MEKSLTLYYLPNCQGCHKLMETKWKDYQNEFMGGLIKFNTIDLSKNPKPPSELSGGEMTKVPTLVFRNENFFTKIKDPFEMSTQEKTLLEGGALEREIIANIIGGYERWKAENVPAPTEISGGRRRMRMRRMYGGEDLKGGETKEIEGGSTEEVAKTISGGETLSGGAVPKNFDLEGGDFEDLEGGEDALEGGGRKRKVKYLSKGGRKYRCTSVKRSKKGSKRRCSKKRSKSRKCSKGRKGSFGRKVKAYMSKHPGVSLPTAAKRLSKGK